jgi:hypothetical protein
MCESVCTGVQKEVCAGELYESARMEVPDLSWPNPIGVFARSAISRYAYEKRKNCHPTQFAITNQAVTGTRSGTRYL